MAIFVDEVSLGLEPGMGSSQSYSVSAVSAPLSKSQLSFTPTETPPPRDHSPYLRKEEGQMKRKPVRELYSKEEAVRGDSVA